MLQQYLPFTVLKRCKIYISYTLTRVATVLTVYGIETFNMWSLAILAPCVATVLTVYGIETLQCLVFHPSMFSLYVATVLTVYGIETRLSVARPAVFKISLQQYLPFTVLKPASFLASPLARPLASCNSTYRLRY